MSQVQILSPRFCETLETTTFQGFCLFWGKSQSAWFFYLFARTRRSGNEENLSENHYKEKTPTTNGILKEHSIIVGQRNNLKKDGVFIALLNNLSATPKVFGTDEILLIEK